MESKWFTGIPENFDTDWCTIACPVGQRCLVMAIDGETKCFSKKGYRLPGYFLSVLPGGNGTEYGFGPTVVTLLDCIYCEEMLTYFILDCMMWASHDIKEYPFSDRMKFVKREIQKRPEFKNITELNMFKFVPLYQYDSTLEGLDHCLRQSTFEVDGILFYKKDIQYKSGETDEVLWIKPYILPDVFEGIAVPKKLMSEKPNTYTDFESFVDDVSSGKIKSIKNKQKKKSKPFNPSVKLNLPPPEEPVNKESNKKKKKQNQPQGQGWNNRGPGNGRERIASRGRPGSGRGGGGRGMDNYARLLAGKEGGRAVYGKGTVSGFNYYGDDRDLYYSDQGYGSDMRGKRERGYKQDTYRMADMQAALSYYDFESGQKSSRGRPY